MAQPGLAHRLLGARGPWVVVLHGLFGSGRNWQGIARALADTRRLCLVDLRNHGASPWADAMDYPSMAADVSALLDRLGIDRAALVGHSMGGKVAMWLALTAPERVERLVVVDIAPVAYTHDHGELLDAMSGLALNELSGRAAAEAALAAAVPDRALRQFLVQNLAIGVDGLEWRINLGAIRASMSALTGFPATDRRYLGPALAVLGGASAYVDADGEQALRARLADLRLVRLAGAGHWLHTEQPDAVVDLLRGFLTDAPIGVPR